jgi:hypothetical protein
MGGIYETLQNCLAGGWKDNNSKQNIVLVEIR